MSLNIFKIEFIFIRDFLDNINEWIFLSTTGFCQCSSAGAFVDWFVARKASGDGLLERDSERRGWNAIVLGISRVSERADRTTTVIAEDWLFVFISWREVGADSGVVVGIGKIGKIVWDSVCSHDWLTDWL